MPSWPTAAVRLLLAEQCRRDYATFCRTACGMTHPQNPEYVKKQWWDDGAHTEFCRWMQTQLEEWLATRHKRTEPMFLLVDAARGFAKSMLVTKGVPLWLGLRDPDLSIVISSVEGDTSREFAEYIKNIYEGRDAFAYYTWFYGKWQGSSVWTRDRFTHAARRVNKTDASIETSSVETGITGKHPDVVVLDDPVTEEKLRESGNWLDLASKHLTSIEPALLPSSLFIFVGTPYADADPLTTAIRRDGIRSLAGLPLPREYDKHRRPDGRWRLFHYPARDADAKPTLPRVWPENRLKWYQETKPAQYASQAMLCPGGSDLVPLSYAQIEEMLINKEQVPKHLPVSIHLDCAFKDPKRIGKGDWSVLVQAEHDRSLGDVYYTRAEGSNGWRDDDLIDVLIKWVQELRRDRRRIIAITDDLPLGGHGKDIWRKRLESAFHDAGMHMPRFEQLNRAGTRKDVRISEAAGYWIDGHVHLVRASGLDMLMEQMARIGISQHKDYADAAADAFNPVIYNPMMADLVEEDQPPPRRPLDDYLQTGILTRAAARELYDLDADKYTTHFRPPIRIER